MKADDYAAKILGDLDDHGRVKPGVVVSVAWQMMLEIKKIAESRKVSSNEGMAAVLDEVDAKWKAVRRRVERAGHPDVLTADGMERLIREKLPDSFQFWRVEPKSSRNELYEGCDL